MSDNFPPPPPEQPQPEHLPPGAPPAQPSPWAAPPGPPQKQRTGLIVTLAVGGGLVVAGAVVALVYSAMDSVEDSIALPPRSEAPYSEPYEEEPYEEPYEEGPGEAAPEPTTTEPDVKKDVTIIGCTRDPGIGWQSAKVKVVNGSSTTASYTIMMEFLDKEGVKVAEGGAGVVALEPGGSAVRKAQGVGEVPPGTTCRISDIWRTPSESAD
ncbi:hypothetical protein K7395_05785 [Streptomyces filamentosus]|uniref:DUF4352 domain-containing protein n=2 Tax=Streptomyces filamentosus TaxID=67294 RepID=A0ABY4V5H9_STRFL|nr:MULTISPECIES: hypothetical protein [Streptomyces]EFE78404.1 predicted protein [Streptomyces filamentosus NRRL 15998]ESU51793.1 hypothetical protein P376_0238 [Streptomyces sp. HCCB10043]EWS95285.1 hypothetical protein SSIG_06012 [Streptomyces filamentosus NRRL 11379]MYR82277.1 hypothetical protein [Streptomyces sp. SID5466]USC51835.1 hypothetical protein K7395_05785 [Streptomyces filamentosus]